MNVSCIVAFSIGRWEQVLATTSCLPLGAAFTCPAWRIAWWGLPKVVAKVFSFSVRGFVFFGSLVVIVYFILVRWLFRYNKWVGGGSWPTLQYSRRLLILPSGLFSHFAYFAYVLVLLCRSCPPSL